MRTSVSAVKKERACLAWKSSWEMIVLLQDHKLHLAADELTAVRKNLQTQGCDVEAEYVSAMLFLLAFLCGDDL